jgi:sigma-B regulation protein RsbU (phosphoserine phosphatase)
MEREMRIAHRVQMALLPSEVPAILRGVDVAGRFAAALELGGDLHDFLAPEPETLVVAVGDVSGKGVPAALYAAFAAELVRSRTLRRRYTPERFSVAGVLGSMNAQLQERQLEEYYCTLCYAMFDLKRKSVVLASSGLPYPVRCSGSECGQIEVPGVPLGSFEGVTYDEVTLALAKGDVFVFATDGIFEAMNGQGAEFGARRLIDTVSVNRHLSARGVVDAIFGAIRDFRGDAPQNDDMTAVAVKIQ